MEREKEKKKKKKSKQLINIPCSADEVIASLENTIDTTNRNTIILIKILSERRWTAYELSLLVLEHPYDTQGISKEKLADNLWDRLFYFKRRYSGMVFDIWKKEWFVPGTIADPKIQQAIVLRKKSFGPIVKKGQRRRRGERSLRSLMVEILSKQGPLEQRELVFAIKRHPNYHCMYPNHLALRKAINCALRNGSKKKRHRRLFKKCDDGLLLAKWEAISEVTPPPIRTKPQTEALSFIMSYFKRAGDWSVAELADLAMQSGSGYSLSSSATRESVQENIAQDLRRHRGVVFEKRESSFGARWQLKKQQPIRISLEDRLNAIDLLSKGITLSHMIEILSVKHPGLDWNIIRRLYSPSHGPFSISKLEGASRDIIELSKRKLRIIHNRLTFQVKGICGDRGLIERKLNILARCRNSHQLRILDELMNMGIKVVSESQRGWLQVGNIRTPESISLLQERQQIVTSALNVLSDVEKLIIEMVIFDDYSLSETSVVLRKPEEEISSLLDSALRELSTNKYLEELI